MANTGSSTGLPRSSAHLVPMASGSPRRIPTAARSYPTRKRHLRPPARSQSHLPARLPELEPWSVQSLSCERADGLPVPRRGFQLYQPSELVRRERLQWNNEHHPRSNEPELWQSTYQRRRGRRWRTQLAALAPLLLLTLKGVALHCSCRGRHLSAAHLL